MEGSRNAPAGVDFGRHADDYARFRGGFPAELFERLRTSFGVGLPGQRLLDVCTGTGALAREFARRGCRVTATDPSQALLEQAQRLDSTIEYLPRTAEASGLADSSFDAASAGRCWHWFDRPAAAAELRRVLVAGGTLVIAHFDRISLATGDVLASTEALLRRFNPAWEGGPALRFGCGVGRYPDWVDDLGAAGFERIETLSFDVAVPYSHESWRGRVRSGGAVAALAPPDVAALDAQLQRLLHERHPEQPLRVTQRAFAVVARAPA